MNSTWKRRRLAIAALSCIAFSGQRANAGLIITPFFDNTVTAGQQTVINDAITFYQSSFINPINVTIEFITSGAGGSSSASLYYTPIANAQTLLQNDSNANPQNTVLNQALTQFAGGNSAPQMQVNSADCRALGANCPGTMNGTGSVAQNGLDGIITVGAGDYGDTSTVMHEINEILGIGGWGTILGDPQVVGGQQTIAMLDPYRYSGDAAPSLTLSTSATAYFSIDGGFSDIADFNQSGTGDYGDWTTTPCRVQSFSICANPAAETLGSPEGIALQAIGYDPAVPEPGTWMLAIGGVCLFAAFSRTRKRIESR